MSERFHPRYIYPYPIVQYIPLDPAELLSGHLPQTEYPEDRSPQPLPHIAACLSQEQLTAALVDNGIWAPEARTVEWARNLALACVGALVREGNYRANEVPLVGCRTPSEYEVYIFPCRYFYKNFLRFTLHDEAGYVLTTAAITLPGNLETASGQKACRLRAPGETSAGWIWAPEPGLSGRGRRPTSMVSRSEPQAGNGQGYRTAGGVACYRL